MAYHSRACAMQVGQASRGIARFAFDELCNRTLGAADYIAVAQAFHTVFLTDIPTMSLKVILLAMVPNAWTVTLLLPRFSCICEVANFAILHAGQRSSPALHYTH